MDTWEGKGSVRTAGGQRSPAMSPLSARARGPRATAGVSGSTWHSSMGVGAWFAPVFGMLDGSWSRHGQPDGRQATTQPPC
eukprot:scaffold8669_cov111-Isochrysis_galbana.AAC.1